MNKNAVKEYAIWARRELIDRVSQKAFEYGIERDQIVKVTTNMDMAFNYAEKLNRDIEEKSPNFAPSKGYYNESKQNNSKVFLTESRLNQIISESIKRAILKEGFFDSFPSVHETGKSLKKKQELRRKK